MSKLEELTERVDRLLMRHAEARRTAALLQQQVAALTQERDSLRARLNAARQRLDGLIDKLPQDTAPSPVLPAAAPKAWGAASTRIEPTLGAPEDPDAAPRPSAVKQIR